MSRPKPKVKMYIEVKPGQDEMIKEVSYPRTGLEIDTGKVKVKIPSFPAKEKMHIVNFFKLHGVFPKEISLSNHSKYKTIRGHKITKISKTEQAIPVRGLTLDEVLLEVQEVEKELKAKGIKYERKCTWVCGM